MSELSKQLSTRYRINSAYLQLCVLIFEIRLPIKGHKE